MVEFEVPEIDYTQYTNRQLAAVPLAVLALALLVLGAWTFAVSPTGVPVNPGIDFTGGTELQIQTTDSKADIADAFSVEPESIQTIQSKGDVHILTFQASGETAIELENQAEAAGYVVESSTSKSARFGSDTQQLALFGVLVAFVGMSLVVFLLFRSFVPSIAVVISAFSDIVIPVAVMNLLGLELTLGTVAALLMLIGYSVDSDLLLNNHILRRSGGFYESTYRAMRTGVTMTLTSISAMLVMTIVSTFFGIPLLPAIGFVLVIGLSVDLMNTYMLNLSLLRWYKFEGVKR